MARKPKLGLPLQTLRNAPDAMEGRRLRGGVAEISTDRIETDGRFDDRLALEVAGLKASIEQNGQRVPILVRPLDADRYALIYGRRRLEACRELGIAVRAIVTEMASEQALRDQLLENQERRDLSFIERALVAAALLEGDHLSEQERSNKSVAEVLNLTEAGVSQLLSVVRTVGEDLIQAIGVAPGIGRPRWEELKKLLQIEDVDQSILLDAATAARAGAGGSGDEKSDIAFLAVLTAAQNAARGKTKVARKPDAGIDIHGVGAAHIATASRGKLFKLDLKAHNAGFVRWLATNTPELLSELHDRWTRSEGAEPLSTPAKTGGTAAR